MTGQIHVRQDEKVDLCVQLQGKTLARAIQVQKATATIKNNRAGVECSNSVVFFSFGFFLGNNDKMMKLCHQVNLKTSDVTFFCKNLSRSTTIYWLNRCKDSPGQKFVVVVLFHPTKALCSSQIFFGCTYFKIQPVREKVTTK